MLTNKHRRRILRLCVTVNPSIYPFVCSSIHLSVHPSVLLSVCQRVCLSVMLVLKFVDNVQNHEQIRRVCSKMIIMIIVNNAVTSKP